MKKNRATERSALTEKEQHLLKLAVNGDDKAFTDLVTQCKDRLYMRALSCSRDDDDADDLVQEAVIKSYRFLKNFRGESGFCSWLFSILTNTIRSFFRKQKANVSISNGEDQIADGSTMVPEKIELNDRNESLLKAVNELQIKYRELVILHYYDELNYEEISVLTGLRIGTIKSRMNRARELLHRSLSAESKKGGSYA